MPAVIMMLGLLIFAKNFSIFLNVIGLTIVVIGFAWELKRVLRNRDRDEVLKALCFVTKELAKESHRTPRESNDEDDE